jgi:hypothetical protein
MLHACVERFDVMSGRENILGWDGEVNKALVDKFAYFPYITFDLPICLLDNFHCMRKFSCSVTV